MGIAVSLRTLLQSSLDYAGLFPPARLALDDAWREYQRAAASPQRWLLRGFVCPAAGLEQLAELAQREPPPLGRFAVIGRAASPAISADQALARDAADIARFYRQLAQRPGPPLEIAYETRLPGELGQARPFCQQIARHLREHDAVCQHVFLELALSQAAQAALPSPGETPVNFGLKFRTGGLDAAAFPDRGLLAEALAALALRAAGTPGFCWKATAGLHHALPRRDDSIGAAMHGFLNVFVAAALTLDLARGLAEPQRGGGLPALAALAQEVLAIDAGHALHWGENELAWKGRRLSLGQLAAGRQPGLVSFGSCSFAEPVADLQALSLL